MNYITYYKCNYIYKLYLYKYKLTVVAIKDKLEIFNNYKFSL
jgi:hypothetical protein